MTCVAWTGREVDVRDSKFEKEVQLNRKESRVGSDTTLQYIGTAARLAITATLPSSLGQLLALKI